MIKNNFYFLLKNTPHSYPIPIDETAAIEYLHLINHMEFYYNNSCCYDLIDYEKIIYIELTFKDNSEIQDLIKSIKELISANYVFKNQYKNRVLDLPDQEFFNTYFKKDKEAYLKGYHGVPKDFKNKLKEELRNNETI